MRSKNKKNRAARMTMADLTNKHTCYEKAVQCVEAEIDFVDDTFKKLRKRHAGALREDFCGTANTSCEWVKRRRTNTAVAVDLDKKVLKWSKKKRLSGLSQEQRKRITLIRGNVLTVKNEPVDVVVAMNFSYWLLKERKLTIDYFKGVSRSLVADGILFLDAYGGYEAFQELREKTRHEDFTYIWDQHRYNPITGLAKNYIHFKFKDGSKMMRAFSYEWRVWTMPEILEMLAEADFKATVYWEQTDENGDGNGVFIPEAEGTADAGWVAYIVAEK